MVGGFPTAGRFRELLAKYGKVAIAVHLSVSGLSISGFYVAIKNNVDVEGVLHRVGLLGKEVEEATHREGVDDDDFRADPAAEPELRKDDHGGSSNNNNNNNNNNVLISGGSALVLAILCNKALFPVRVPLTFVLTPPIARFLARRKLYSAGH